MYTCTCCLLSLHGCNDMPILTPHLLSPCSQCFKTWSSQKPACFITEKKYQRQGDANSGSSFTQIKRFFRDQTIYPGRKHPCLDCEHGLGCLNSQYSYETEHVPLPLIFSFVYSITVSTVYVLEEQLTACSPYLSSPATTYPRFCII